MLNNYFDKIYLLNLIKRKDRRDKIIPKLNILNINVDVFNAIDSSIIEDIFDRYKSSTKQFRFKNKNYFACALSHINIIKNAYDNGYEKILIIEDDILIRKTINSDIVDYMTQIPTDWDMIHFAYIPLSDDMMQWNYNLNSNNFVSKNVFKSNMLCSLMGYAINRNMMTCILNKYQNNFDKELDIFFMLDVMKNNNFNCYGITPQLFIGYNDYSDNTNIFEDSIEMKSLDNRYGKLEEYI